MPVYESEELPRDKLEELRKKSKCKECGGWVNMFLDPESGKAFLACNDWLRTHHDGIMREGRLFEENIVTRRERMVKELGKDKATALAPYAGAVLKTETEAMEVLRTVWPDAPVENMRVAALICVQYELNPLMKHIYLLPFKTKGGGTTWATVLGIQANRLIAHRAGDYSYEDDTPRIMTRVEEERIFGEVLDDRIWAITKLKDAKGNEAVGYGFYLKSENPYGTDKGNTRANMAFIRSERQAMDRLFAGKLPQAIDVMDERYMVTVDDRQVDTITGEIQEPKAETAVADKPEPKPEPEVVEGEIVSKDALPFTATPKGEDVTEEQAQLISAEQLASLKELMAKVSFTATDIGAFCNKEQGWNIRELKDLKVWQYDMVVDHIKVSKAIS